VGDRWRRIGELFGRAVALPPQDRDALLQASPEDDDIKREVRELLDAHDNASDFLDQPDAAAAAAEPPVHGVGTFVGPYRIVRLIGRGGMGIVYEAEDTRLHRRVALKAVLPELAVDERRRQRLRHEARTAAKLQHPGIATVYSLDEIDGDLFIASEYLAGETLRDEIRRGALPTQAAHTTALDLARALAAAHDRGIVHRDLKPENVVRTGDGAVKILDFGLAQFDSTDDDPKSRSRLSVAGAMAGTPAYMAPEQLLSRPTDFRVDHFAFGVLLYELCTGAHPFESASTPGMLARILADSPDPPPARSPIPPPLWKVIERSLQKDPAHRFPTTRDLIAALESAADAPRASAPARDDTERVQRPASGREGGSVSALRWWRFHQFAAALAYWSMVWPMWAIHRSLGRAGLFFFFATLAAVVVAGNLRLHLWFSSRVYPEDLAARRADVGRWIRCADIAFAALLIMAGIALPAERVTWAAVLIAFGIGAAVAFIVIEPATTRAAFRVNAGSAAHPRASD
jgi:serine/threonine protein kinase